MRRLAGLTMALLLGLTAGTHGQVIRIGVHVGNGEPYAFLQNEEVVGGLIKDIGDELGVKLGSPVAYEVLPRKRLEGALIRGEITILPIYNPTWAESPDKMLWSVPLFDENNRVLTKPDRVVRGAGDLDGLAVGTILGYFYPTLEDAFRRPGGPEREDTPSLEQNILKLASGRIDALVESDILLAWHMKNLPPNLSRAQFRLGEWTVSSQRIYWAISAASWIEPARLQRALAELRDSGKIEAFLSRYR